jgi:hypothetical protein
MLSERLSGREESKNPIIRLIRNQRLFKVALLAAVALGVTGISSSSSNDSTGTSSSSNPTLRKVSTALFVALTVLQAFHTVVLAMDERKSQLFSCPSVAFNYD